MREEDQSTRAIHGEVIPEVAVASHGVVDPGNAVMNHGVEDPGNAVMNHGKVDLGSAVMNHGVGDLRIVVVVEEETEVTAEAERIADVIIVAKLSIYRRIVEVGTILIVILIIIITIMTIITVIIIRWEIALNVVSLAT